MGPNDGYNGAVAAKMSHSNANNAGDQQQDDPIRSSIEQDNNQPDQSDTLPIVAQVIYVFLCNKKVRNRTPRGSPGTDESIRTERLR